MKEYDKMMLRSRKQMSETNMLMILLTISGGLQDAYSYFVRGEVFSNAQTGNIVLMSQKATGTGRCTILYLCWRLQWGFS